METTRELKILETLLKGSSDGQTLSTEAKVLKINKVTLTNTYDSTHPNYDGLALGNNTAPGDHSFAMGNGTSAQGHNSFTQGLGTIAKENNQTVLGKYNADNSNAYLIVGKGTNSASRSNAFEVMNDGRIKIYGAPTESEDGVTKGYLEGKLPKMNGSITYSNSGYYSPTSSGNNGEVLISSGSGAPGWTPLSITLNGQSTLTPSFYAPTLSGTKGDWLRSHGPGYTPDWQGIYDHRVRIIFWDGNVSAGKSTEIHLDIFNNNPTPITNFYSIFDHLYYKYSKLSSKVHSSGEIFPCTGFRTVWGTQGGVITHNYYSIYRSKAKWIEEDEGSEIYVKQLWFFGAAKGLSSYEPRFRIVASKSVLIRDVPVKI